MLRIVERITQDHDLGLVALAFLVCVLAANSSVRLFDPHGDGEPRYRVIRCGAAILAFGNGVWTTQFICLLAYRPDLSVSFDGPRCFLSLVLGIVATAVAFSMRLRERGAIVSIIVSGLVLAAGIGAVQFVGMRAMLVPPSIHYDPNFVVASLSVGAPCTITAMWLLERRTTGWASIFLTLAVLLTHFVGLGSATLTVAGGLDVTPLTISKPGLAMATASAGLLILALAMAAAILDERVTGRLATEARRFGAMANATFEGLILERDGRIVDANRAMRKLAATEAASLIGRPLSDLIPGIELRESDRGRPVTSSLRLSNGRTLPVEILCRSGAERGERVAAVRDISHEKTVEVQIERMARLDALTGVANRALFERQLDQALAQSDRTMIGAALFYIDLDLFESFIDASDHHAADQILVQTARRLSASVPETDTVARFGRDEFVIIQARSEQPAVAAALADRIVEAMAVPFSVDDQPIAVTAGVGGALYPADRSGGQNLIRSAVLAVRQAKNGGCARWRYFEPGMDLLLRTKRSLEHDLRIALKENQFSVNYQPFVGTATLDVAGYEALLRWDHPTRGRIAPADFIPLAEESGLIVPIGSWVLATACAEAVSWDQTVIISVNLSPAQFVQPGIVSTVGDVLHQTGLPPNRLELEITEGTLMNDTRNALRILTSLKALGVKLAMDDFGTGYSSLSYLRKFPFDKIKIDRSFMSDLEDTLESETIVQAIVAMGRGLRLAVTAEGVETTRQLAMLRALGCDFAQGYLTGRPRSADQLDQYVGKPRRHVIEHTGPRLVASTTARSS